MVLFQVLPFPIKVLQAQVFVHLKTAKIVILFHISKDSLLSEIVNSSPLVLKAGRPNKPFDK